MFDQPVGVVCLLATELKRRSQTKIDHRTEVFFRATKKVFPERE